METIAKRIKFAREKSGLTQEKLAEMLGVDKNTVSRWETGNRGLPNKRLYQIAKILKINIESLITEDDPTVLLEDNNIPPIKMDFPHSSGQIIKVPIFERAYSACCGSGFPNADQIYSCAEDFIDMPTNFIGQISPDPDKRPFMIYAEGDSMIHAGITDGSQLLINPAEEIYDGDSVLVEYGHNKNIAVKRIYWLNGSGIEIRSANGDGWKRTFTLDDQKEGLLRIIGKVVWYGNKPKRG